jgi:hypothetical protein
MRFVLVSALLALPPAQAAAADWRVVLTSEEERLGRSVGFVDVATVERSGGDRRFWMDLRIERAPGRADGIRARVHADCGSRSYETSDGAYYLGDQRLHAAEPEPMRRAEAGQNMYVLLDNLCNDRYLSGSVDPSAYSAALFGRR